MRMITLGGWNVYSQPIIHLIKEQFELTIMDLDGILR
jgi:hypothetical protein